MVAAQSANGNNPGMERTADSSDDSAVRASADLNGMYAISMSGSYSTGDSSVNEDFQRLLSAHPQDGATNAHSGGVGKKKSPGKKVSFDVPPLPPFLSKGTKGARKRDKRAAPKHSVENNSHKHSRRKIYTLQRENKKLKQENKFLRGLLGDFVQQQMIQGRGEEEPKLRNMTDDIHFKQNSMVSSNVENERKVLGISKRMNSNDTEETSQIPLQLTSSEKVSFLPALLSQNGRPREGANDTITTAAMESECSEQLWGKEVPSITVDGDKKATNDEEIPPNRDLPNIRTYSFDCPNWQLDEQHQKAAVSLLKGTMEQNVSLTLELEVAKDELSTLKMTHATELKDLEEKRLEEVRLLKNEVAQLEDIVETVKNKSSSLEKRLEQFESDQAKKDNTVEPQAEVKKDYQNQLRALNESLEKQEELEEKHRKEKKDILERHAKETEEYKRQLGVLKKAVTKLVKKKNKESNMGESMRSIDLDNETKQIITQYEKKIQGMKEEHTKKVKQLKDGSVRLKKMLLNMEKHSIRAEAGYTPNPSQRGLRESAV